MSASGWQLSLQEGPGRRRLPRAGRESLPEGQEAAAGKVEKRRRVLQKKSRPFWGEVFGSQGGQLGSSFFRGNLLFLKGIFFAGDFFLIFVVLWFWPILAILGGGRFWPFWAKMGSSVLGQPIISKGDFFRRQFFKFFVVLCFFSFWGHRWWGRQCLGWRLT